MILIFTQYKSGDSSGNEENCYISPDEFQL